MTLKALEGLKSLETHHCVTGSMRHVYAFNGHDVSEDMLLGLGGGVGFFYWHSKGAPPFLGGRAKGRPGKGFEICAGERTGVVVKEYTTSSTRKAEQSLLASFDAGQPVMLLVDMGFLPYMDFGGYEYHFGAHAVVACGYDPDSRQVLVADRDAELHPLSMDELEKARGSTYQPFAPKHRWYTFDFAARRPPTGDEVRASIAEQVRDMLEPPITNQGVKGIRKAAKRALAWPDQMDEQTLRLTLFNIFIFIDAEGGTGGGLFRYMFGRFLLEAAEITGESRLLESAEAFRRIGDRWQEAAEIFRRGLEAQNPVAVLAETTAPLMELADLEEAAWGQLS